MIQILIIILFLCILAVLYLSKPKWLEKRMPWIWEHIGAPIFRYYFVTTVRPKIRKQSQWQSQLQ